MVFGEAFVKDALAAPNPTGFIREGKFHRPFNAPLPVDHPSHRNFGVPEHHMLLNLNMAMHTDTGILCPNNFQVCGSHGSV